MEPLEQKVNSLAAELGITLKEEIYTKDVSSTVHEDEQKSGPYVYKALFGGNGDLYIEYWRARNDFVHCHIKPKHSNGPYIIIEKKQCEEKFNLWIVVPEKYQNAFIGKYIGEKSGSIASRIAFAVKNKLFEKDEDEIIYHIPLLSGLKEVTSEVVRKILL